MSQICTAFSSYVNRHTYFYISTDHTNKYKKQTKQNTNPRIHLMILMTKEPINPFLGDPFTSINYEIVPVCYVNVNTVEDIRHIQKLHQNIVYNKAEFATGQYFRNLDEGKMWETKRSLDFIVPQMDSKFQFQHLLAAKEISDTHLLGPLWGLGVIIICLVPTMGAELTLMDAILCNPQSNPEGL